MAQPPRDPAERWRAAFRSDAQVYAKEDKEEGLKPAKLWSLAADAIRCEAYAQAGVHFEKLCREGKTDDAHEHLDVLEEWAEEPRGSFDKRVRRLVLQKKN